MRATPVTNWQANTWGGLTNRAGKSGRQRKRGSITAGIYFSAFSVISLSMVIEILEILRAILEESNLLEKYSDARYACAQWCRLFRDEGRAFTLLQGVGCWAHEWDYFLDLGITNEIIPLFIPQIPCQTGILMSLDWWHIWASSSPLFMRDLSLPMG
jgi:hypothetical protein